jgi:transposase
MPKKLESNYDRNIFEQLYEALELVDKLRSELTEAKKTAGKEKTKKETQEQTKIEEMKAWHRREMYLLNEKQEKAIKSLKATQSAEMQELKGIIKEQTLEIALLKEENAALREMLNKNSGNSSKPPSLNGFKKIFNSRVKSGKKPGGQIGHKGNPPKYFTNPTKIIEMKMKNCRCGGKVQYSEESYTKKQLAELEIKTKVIEYREYTGVCEWCGRAVVNRSPLKDSINYGSKLKSFINMLSVEGNISINRLRQILSEISGGLLRLSEGTICKWNKDLSKLLAPSIQTIKEKLLVSPVLHKDETGVWVDTKLNWLHVLSNDKYTLYYSEKRRGKDADTEAGVLPAYKGVLVHDNLKSLYHFTCTHAECNAHILRYLKGIIETKERKWAKDMIDFLMKAKSAAQTTLSSNEILEFHNLYDEILDKGRSEHLRDENLDRYGDDVKLLRRLREYKTEHLRFLSDRTVPFDNNQAERDLRMIKAKTKISGCFRSIDGDSVFATIKSYTSSLRKNTLNIFDALCSAWCATPVLF